MKTQSKTPPVANVVTKHSISSELAQKMVDEAVAKATHQTAPTQFVEANGIRFAYRRFGNPRGVPLVFSPHTPALWITGIRP